MPAHQLTAFPRVGIIILNWNGKADTVECLHSLRKIDYPNYQVIVVDNGSTDDSVQTFRDQFPEIIVLPQTENLGFAEGSNCGIEYALAAGCDYVLLLNNDTVVAPDFLTELIAVGEHYPEIGMLSPVMYYYQSDTHVKLNKSFFQTLHDEGVPDDVLIRLKSLKYQKFSSIEDLRNAIESQIGEEQTASYHALFLKHAQQENIWFCAGEVHWNTGEINLIGDLSQVKYLPGDSRVIESDFLAGCAQLVKAEVIRKIGLLDPKFFAYFEDADWSFRCQHAGWKTVVVTTAKIWHKVASTAPANIVLIWHYRNLILLCWKESTLFQFPGRCRHIVAACLRKSRKYRGSELGEAVMHGVWSAITLKFGKAYRPMPQWMLHYIDHHIQYFLKLFQ